MRTPKILRSSVIKPSVVSNCRAPLHNVTCTRAPTRRAESAMIAPASVRYDTFTCGLGIEPEQSTYKSKSSGSFLGKEPSVVPHTLCIVVMPGTMCGLTITLWNQSAASSGEPMSHGSSPSGNGSVDSGIARVGKRIKFGVARSL